LLSWGPLAGAGAISYGLYVFHLPVIHGDLGNAWLLQALIAPGLPWEPTAWLFALPFTFAMALLSWHLLEAPMLRWRERELNVVRGNWTVSIAK
jgi:peptidoglycan/LPS O-acetylase OafA/YrhL